MIRTHIKNLKDQRPGRKADGKTEECYGNITRKNINSLTINKVLLNSKNKIY